MDRDEEERTFRDEAKLFVILSRSIMYQFTKNTMHTEFPYSRRTNYGRSRG